jgi:hypothetical protein
MAKAKPQRKVPAGSSTPASAKLAAATGGGRFDLTNAMETAAALVGNRARQTGKTPKKESLEFRMLKEGVNDPGIQSIEDILDKTSAPAARRGSGHVAEHGTRQGGHHQTTGADVTRTGVPRRTGG